MRRTTPFWGGSPSLPRRTTCEEATTTERDLGDLATRRTKREAIDLLEVIRSALVLLDAGDLELDGAPATLHVFASRDWDDLLRQVADRARATAP